MDYLNGIAQEKILEDFYPYIVTKAEQAVRQYSLGIDKDDLVQDVSIKFWKTCQRQLILNPKAYIQSIIYHDIVDFLRNPERDILSPLPFNEHGEPYENHMIRTPGEGMGDPLEDMLEREQIAGMNINEIVVAILQLPRQQKNAMLYKLKNTARDAYEIENAFVRRGIDFMKVAEPKTRKEWQRMQASYSLARNKLRSVIEIENAPAGKSKRLRWKRKIEEENSSVQNGNLKTKTEEAKDLREIVKQVNILKEPYRTSVRLYHCEHHSYNEIAVELNVPVNTVKAHVRRGLQTLEEFMELRDTGNALSKHEERIRILTEIKTHINQLKEPYHTTIRLRYIENYSCAKIAQELMLPIGTVKAHISRGLKMLGIVRVPPISRIEDEIQEEQNIAVG